MTEPTTAADVYRHSPNPLAIPGSPDDAQFFPAER
jgi:hypothetical protein